MADGAFVEGGYPNRTLAGLTSQPSRSLKDQPTDKTTFPDFRRPAEIFKNSKPPDEIELTSPEVDATRSPRPAGP